MKANVHRTSVGKKRFHGCPLRLTIGIIVKNSAKTLEKCLESVKPLLDAVPSELIVTDTGSTDETVEIAERYTNHIIHFQWCDDFSAARNTGLNAARGEWFLFLDSDEWFDDVSELIAFFQGTECDRFGSGCYIQRNYMDSEGKNYSDFHAVRIFRRYPGIRFEHSIHEAVQWLRPIRFFNSYVHHYGYAFRSAKEKQGKVRRNLCMMEKALEKKPDDMKLLYQMSRQYFTLKQYEKIVEFCRRGLTVEQNHPQREWRLSFYSVLLKAYYDSKRYREVVDTVRECTEADSGVELPYLDYYLFETFSYFYMQDYKEAVCAGERYGQTFALYRQGKLNREYLLYGNDIGIDPIQHENVAVVTIQSLIALEKYGEAVRKLSQIDFAVADVIGQKISVLCFILSEKTERPEIVPEYYGRILATGDLAKKQDFIGVCEAYLKQRPENRKAVVHAFAVSGCRDNYAIMNRMRDTGVDREAFQKLLQALAPDAMGWDAHYSDVIYLAMKSQADISPLFDVVDRDSLPGLILGAEREHADSGEIFLNYFSHRSFAGMKSQFWIICFEERILQKYRNFNSREMLAYLRKYVRDLNDYAEKIYRHEIFTEESSLLPRRIRFGWHMRRAFELKAGNGAGYVHELRAALEDCPGMKEPIGLLLKQFEDESKKVRERSTEFANLAGKVKKQIEDLIDCGRLEDAGRVTAGLAALLPEDEDVRRYRKLTHTEPSLQELASRTPQ